MTTHATAGKEWTEDQLSQLTVEQDVRLRGLEVTRLDTFVDAAFAFVLTLLVISFDDIPSNIPEMLAAVKQIPAFGASFAMLMWFWIQHRRWSRRYGLENQATILTSLALMFVMLVYVYPLRMIFEGMFSQLSGGYLETTYEIDTFDDLRLIFIFYAAGFVAMSLLVSQLYRMALRSGAQLGLNDVETRRTRVEMHTWAIAAGFGVMSSTVAFTVPDYLVPLAGYLYFALFPAMLVPAYLDRRRHSPQVRASGS